MLAVRSVSSRSSIFFLSSSVRSRRSSLQHLQFSHKIHFLHFAFYELTGLRMMYERSSELWRDYYHQRWCFTPMSHSLHSTHPSAITLYVQNPYFYSIFLPTLIFSRLPLTCNESVRIHSSADNMCAKNKLAWMVFLKQRRSLCRRARTQSMPISIPSVCESNEKKRRKRRRRRRRGRREESCERMNGIKRFHCLAVRFIFIRVWHCKRRSPRACACAP